MERWTWKELAAGDWALLNPQGYQLASVSRTGHSLSVTCAPKFGIERAKRLARDLAEQMRVERSNV